MKRFEGLHSTSSLTVDEAVAYAISEAAVGPDGRHIPIKQVAAAMNLPLSVVYDIASGRRPLRARELALTVLATRCVLPVDVIERDLSRVGVALPVMPIDGDPVLEKAAEACREFGEWMAKVGECAMDRKYTEAEVIEAETEGHQAIAVIHAALSQMRAQMVATRRPRAVGGAE